MDTASTEIFPQIVIGLAITTAIFFIFLVVEQMWRAYLSFSAAKIAVYPYTGSSAKTIIIKQDPANPKSKTLALSENQLTGIEFSYTTFLYISDENDQGTTGWRTVFYKGYESGPFPLCGPGVFVSTKSNYTPDGGPTLRVVMNTYDTWFNTIDVKRIPFNKWVHLALVLRNNTMEVYVNGNLATKKTFNGTLPYQNYQPLILFPSATTATEFDATSATKRGIPKGENFVINGKFSGYISNLFYHSYAISYSQIQQSLNLGPSSQFEESSMDKPPYLIDSWWTSRA